MSGGGKKKEKGGTKRRDGRRWGDGVEREGGGWGVCACGSVVCVRCDERERGGGGKEEVTRGHGEKKRSCSRTGQQGRTGGGSQGQRCSGEGEIEETKGAKLPGEGGCMRRRRMLPLMSQQQGQRDNNENETK